MEEQKKIRIALLIQYDGTGFNGWQIQSYGRTVQGDIEEALEILTKNKVGIIASGRTDSGVHAIGQVAHFDLENRDDINKYLSKLCTGLNGILNPDVAIKNAYIVPPDFHSRYSAVSREYIYRIYNHPQKSPFINKRAMWVRNGLDLEYLHKTAEYLKGEHDYASFCKKISSDINTVRRIDEIDIAKQGDLISIRISGTAFLHNMIRIIIGTMIEMYKDNKEPGYIKEILFKKDRDYSGTTAPPYGLYLNKITYNPPLSDMESAF